MAGEVLIAGGLGSGQDPQSLGVLGLLLITLGIYSVFWWFYVNREMRDYGHATGNDLGQNPMNSALAWFPGGPHHRAPHRHRVEGHPAGPVGPARRWPPLLSGWIALILYILLSIAFPSYIQSELNKVREKVGTPLTGESLRPSPRRRSRRSRIRRLRRPERQARALGDASRSTATCA